MQRKCNRPVWFDHAEQRSRVREEEQFKKKKNEKSQPGEMQTKPSLSAGVRLSQGVRLATPPSDPSAQLEQHATSRENFVAAARMNGWIKRRGSKIDTETKKKRERHSDTKLRNNATRRPNQTGSQKTAPTELALPLFAAWVPKTQKNWNPSLAHTRTYHTSTHTQTQFNAPARERGRKGYVFRTAPLF